MFPEKQASEQSGSREDYIERLLTKLQLPKYLFLKKRPSGPFLLIYYCQIVLLAETPSEM